MSTKFKGWIDEQKKKEKSVREHALEAMAKITREELTEMLRLLKLFGEVLSPDPTGTVEAIRSVQHMAVTFIAAKQDFNQR